MHSYNKKPFKKKYSQSIISYLKERLDAQSEFLEKITDIYMKLQLKENN